MSEELEWYYVNVGRGEIVQLHPEKETPHQLHFSGDALAIGYLKVLSKSNPCVSIGFADARKCLLDRLRERHAYHREEANNLYTRIGAVEQMTKDDVDACV